MIYSSDIMRLIKLFLAQLEFILSRNVLLFIDKVEMETLTLS